MSPEQHSTQPPVTGNGPSLPREPLTPLTSGTAGRPRGILLGLGAGALVIVLVAAVAGAYFLTGSPSATPTPSSHPAALGSPTAAASGSPVQSQTSSASPSARPSASGFASAAPSDGGEGCGGPGPVVPIAAARPNEPQAAVLAADPAPGHFGPTGALMLSGIGYDTATRLADGKILFVGGAADGSAAAYDPAANKFTRTGSMVRPRGGPVAVLLNSGKVMVLGGHTIGGCAIGMVEEVELWDPATGHFTSLGTPLPGQTYQTATLLANGKVLIGGGEIDDGSGNLTASAALYDPATGNFTATGADANNHMWSVATRLPSGKVLLAGTDFNCSGPSCIATPQASTYDPATGHFTAVTGSIPGIDYAATATLLSDGKVLLAGGEVWGSEDNWTPTKNAFLYDPTVGSNGAFSATGSMSVARQEAVAVRLPNGSVLIAGGFDGTTILASTEIYNPATGTFAATNPMTVARSGQGFTARLLSNGLVLVLGNNSSDFYKP